MTRSLLEKYREGMITDDHLVVESLQLLDPENPGLALSGLPDAILIRMDRFANEYLLGKMIANYGEMPGRDQVLAARNWLDESLRQMANKTV